MAITTSEPPPAIGARRSIRPDVHGTVTAPFEAVREAFVENFSKRRELGGACCVFHHGEAVVDLWGGIRNEQTGEP